MACDHSGYHSGRARYLPASSQLQLMLVCDGCGLERVELERIDYSPPPVLLRRGALAPLEDPRAVRARALARSPVIFVRRASLIARRSPHDVVRLGLQRSLARAARTLGA